MKINVVYNTRISGYADVLNILEKSLIKNKLEFQSFNIDNIEKYGDFTFVIGGDGTLLKAARFYAPLNVPILGINIGRLGFLSQAGVDDIENAISLIIKKQYKIEERSMLSSGKSLALNDFVIKGCTPSRTSKFYLEINDEFVCDYIADGLIISTATGSTAYGLSAGGPVLHPALDAIVIVPICPHTLNSRPLVIPSKEKITIKTADKYLAVSADGGTSKKAECISVEMTNYKSKLVFLNNNSFYSVLKNKLHWGISPSSKN